jgi:hypothetical protein
MPGDPYTYVTYGADGESYAPSISDDERYVVFTSEATNLTADADNGATDIFVFDRFTSTTRNLTAGADGDSFGGVVSGDGTTVAFYSEATNLTADPDNGQTDVFKLDLASGTVTNLTPLGDDFSGFPAISDNGSVVAFQSYASNVTVGGDADGGAPDIFTATPGGNIQITTAGDFFAQPTISGDGITVGFQAYGAFGGTDTEPVVVTAGGVSSVRSTTGVYSGEADLSDDGIVAAFRTFTQPDGIIQVGAGDVSDPASASTDPAISDDGTKVAYTEGDDVVLTVVGGATTTVAAGNGPSGDAAIAGNGDVVAFTTYSTDLIPQDANGTIGDIVVRN